MADDAVFTAAFAGIHGRISHLKQVMLADRIFRATGIADAAGKPDVQIDIG